jgi:hypothetical protein
MKYSGIDLDKNLRVIQCPKCNNTEFSENAEYCRICGALIYNKCEGEWNEREECLESHKCQGNARYCEICGKRTYFFNEGFLKSYNTEEEFDEDSPF